MHAMLMDELLDRFSEIVRADDHLKRRLSARVLNSDPGRNETTARLGALPRHGDERRRDLLVSVEEAAMTTVAYGGGIEGGRKVVQEVNGQAGERFEFAPRAVFKCAAPTEHHISAEIQ
jgi:hypothetical protein